MPNERRVFEILYIPIVLKNGLGTCKGEKNVRVKCSLGALLEMPSCLSSCLSAWRNSRTIKRVVLKSDSGVLLGTVLCTELSRTLPEDCAIFQVSEVYLARYLLGRLCI